MKRIEFKKLLLTVLTISTIASAGTIAANAREIGEFQNFKVTYRGNERFTGYLTKAVTGRKGVVNLSNDSGSAWISANMKNSNGAYRGGTNLQRGTRSTFKTPNAKANYQYHLGLKKTNNTGGGTVIIKGSWSPDEK